ncbi:MAG: PucR family transcriptional regulator ligand-binding domain-containing protein [Streptosporangiaceae bacterium]
MLSLRDILDLEVVRRGHPRVVAGDLDSPVRWVHAMELTDVGSLLRGGELVLSTGIALPDDPAGLAAYVRELTAAGVSGLAIELGRRYVTELPEPLVTAAENAGLPVVAFEHEIPFVEITEAVHSRIIDESLAELRAAETIHQTFTELSVAGAPTEQIVQAAARLAGRPVILADLSHRVLACAAADVGGVLDGFADRARIAISTITTRTGLSGNWLITTVGARGEDWGRLFLCDGSADPADMVLVERAATTLALGRLLTRQAESLERQAHRTLITTLLSTSQGDASEAEARARALGVPVTGRQLVSAVVRVPDSGPGLSAHVAVLAAAETVAQACRAASVPALVGSLDDVRAGALLSLPSDSDADAVLDSVAGAVAAQLDSSFVIGAGPVVTTLREARQSMIDAREVADVAFRDPDGRPWYRLPDLRLRGLLHLLRDDARLQAFAERELGALLSYDATHGTDLVTTLSLFLSCGGNKAAAAQRAHLARPTFYQRLRLISRLLDVDLDDSESRTSLHVALLAVSRVPQ